MVKKFNIKDEKVTGYILLIVGLIIMFYSLFMVLNIADTGSVPIEFVDTTSSPSVNNSNNQPGNQTMPSLNMGDVVTPLFPLFNISVWIAISFFILVVGGRISMLGINMLKVMVPDIRIVKSETIKKIDKKQKEPIPKQSEKPAQWEEKK